MVSRFAKNIEFNQNQINKIFARGITSRQADLLIQKLIPYSPQDKFVLCNGGIGDLLLGLAASYANNKCLLLHAANEGMEQTIAQFVCSFDVPYKILEKPFTVNEFENFRQHPLCLSTGHLPSALDYTYWARPEKLTFSTQLPVQQLFGKAQYFSDKGMVAICPRGSNQPPFVEHGDERYSKRRELTQNEYHKLIKKFTRRNIVFALGSSKDLEKYGIINHPRCYWLTFDKIVNYKYEEKPYSISQVLSIINACKLVVSMDTWLKTYSCMAEIPTIVIRTKFNGGYLNKNIDLSENVFLHKRFWNLNVVKIEDLI